MQLGREGIAPKEEAVNAGDLLAVDPLDLPADIINK